MDLIFRSLLMHIRTFQNLQKSQLQLLRPAGIYLIKGIAEALHIFIRKPCNQVEMDMDIFFFPESGNNLPKPFPVHAAPDFFNRSGVRGLYPDFQLN